MKRHLSIPALLVLLGAGSAGAFAQPNTPAIVAADAIATTLQNPGFEEAGRTFSAAEAQPNANGWSASGTVARGWEDNSNWTGTQTVYALDPVNPHGGKFSQRIEVKKIGAAAQFVQGAKVQKDHVYRFGIWLRSPVSTKLEVSVRQGGAPYTFYGQSSVTVSPEWKRYVVLARATEDADVFLMLRATEPMTYFADDASWEDLTNAVSNEAPQKGNLVPGGSFEAGVPFGWNARVEGDPEIVWRNYGLSSVPVSDAPVGKRALQMSVPSGQGAGVELPITPLRFGVPHTLSLWAKSSQPNTVLSLEVDNSSLRSYPQIGTSWQRVTWTFTPPLLDYYRLRFYIPAQTTTQDRVVQFDGVSLEEGTQASANYASVAPIEMTLQATRQGNIFLPGEPVVVGANVSSLPPQNARFALSVEDVNGKTTPLPPQTAQFVVMIAGQMPTGGLPPKAVINLPFANRQGIWKLRAQLQDAKGQNLSAPVEFVWTRLPRPKTLTEAQAKASFFGIHIPVSPAYISLVRDLGLRWIRFHDTSMIAKWPIAEPTPGKFEFYDEQVSAAHVAGLQILGMLDGAPAWTSTRPRTGNGYWAIWNIPDKPGAVDLWRRYVSTVTGHYKGRIDDWEVWNEPWGEWWTTSGNPNATPALYAQLLKAAHEEGHRANPGVNIVGIDTYNGWEDRWTKPALAQTGTNTFDSFSFHDYSDALAGGASTRVRDQAEQLRTLQRAVGEPKPLWNTEGGPGNIGSFYAPQTGGIPPAQQAAYQVRYDVSSMAAGVKHFFIYAIHSGTAMGDPTYRAVEHDYAPRPLLAARAVLASFVDGRGAPKLVNLSPAVTCYAFAPAPGERGGKEVRVVWSNSPDQTATLAVPRGFEALDVWGNPLAGSSLSVGSEPIYLRAR